MRRLVDQIDALLPQYQCARCGFDGCRPYAQAIALGTAEINRCAPGSQSTVDALAHRLGRPSLGLDPRFSVGEPLRRVAIDETRCIGCTLCIKACPVDAIVGAAKQLHTVLSTDCTGCQLCIPPCPVDCIQTEALPIVWGEELAHEARRHALARQARLNRHTAVDQPSLTSAAVEENEIDTDPGSPASNSKRATIDRVVAKARARRAQQLERLAFASAGASDTGELDTLGE